MPTSSPCPSEQVLQQFVLGELGDQPGANLDELANHLERCQRCVTTVESLRTEDSLVCAMRTPGDPPKPINKTVLELIDRLCEGGYTRTAGAVSGAPGLSRADDLDPEEIAGLLSPAEHPDELGRLGPYRVQRVLGVGGMGVVFLAFDPHLRRSVAVKTLKPALAASASARRRFLREAQAVALVTHDHIVPILHVGEERGVPFLVMPLLQGETLQAPLDRGAVFAAAEVLRIGREIAQGLGAAHSQGLIHRDVKPSNVWLEGEQGRVRILDFGLARAIGGDAQLTDTGVIVGTPSFMAPEQARGEAVDARSDLFSLGCVLYLACTGRLPFPGRNAMETLLALAEHRPASPEKWNPRLPAGTSELIMKLLARRPEDRYPDAQAAVTALDEVASGKVPRRRRVRPRMAAVAGLAVLCGLALCWLLLGRPRPQKEAHEEDPAALFAPAVPYAAGLYPVAVVVGDFNGDGKPDLAVANMQSASVSVLLGESDGSFRAPVRSPAGVGFAASLTAADLDGDGKLDLAVTNGTGGDRVYVLLGKGDGTFRSPVPYGVGGNPGPLAVADLNGDGKLDLASANGDGTVSILLGKGDGAFGDAVNYRAGGSAYALVVADFDRDGKPDVAAVLYDKNAVGILLGKGDGAFRPPVTYPVGGSPVALKAGDLDGDGKLDLVIAHNGAGAAVLLGNGDGAFRQGGNFAGDTSCYGLALADLDGDGKLDLVLADTNGNAALLLLGNGDGAFREPLRFAVGRTPLGLAVADFNGDGAPDLAVANKNSNDVSVLLQRPRPAYQAQLGPSALFPAGARPCAVAVADLDRDGKDDLAVADEAGFVQLLHGNGDGSFAAASRHPAGRGLSALALGDFDRDGKTDVAVADSLSHAVVVLRGNGDGSLAPGVAYPVGQNPAAVTAADLDRDGKIDLIVANRESGTVSVLRGNGDGSFGEGRKFPSGGRPSCVAVADVNRDGLPDLVVGSFSWEGSVSVLLGKGDGTFAAPAAYLVGSFNAAVAVADFNGDGRPDLAVANFNSGDVGVLLGNGDGTFRTPVNYSIGFAVALAVVDVDGDGKLDLAATNRFGQTLDVRLGNGDGTFAEEVQRFHTSGLAPCGLAVGHFRRGGRPDFVTADSHTGNVSVLPNRPAVPSLSMGLQVETIEPESMTCLVGFETKPAARGRAGEPVTVHLSSSDPLAVLPRSPTFHRGRSEPARVTFRTPGKQTVTATDADGKLLPCSVSIWVLKPEDLRFELDVPESVEAGQLFGVTVEVKTRLNNWTKGYGGTVRFRCTDTQAKLSADSTFDRGKVRHTFTNDFTLPNPGRWKITVSDPAVPGLSASATVTVLPARGSD